MTKQDILDKVPDPQTILLYKFEEALEEVKPINNITLYNVSGEYIFPIYGEGVRIGECAIYLQSHIGKVYGVGNYSFGIRVNKNDITNSNLKDFLVKQIREFDRNLEEIKSLPS